MLFLYTQDSLPEVYTVVRDFLRILGLVLSGGIFRVYLTYLSIRASSAKFFGF